MHAICGWGSDHSLQISCAFEGCANAAIIRGNNANLCGQHANAIHFEQTQAYLKSIGLDRREGEDRESWLYRMKAWRTQKLADVGRFKSAGEWDEISRQIVADYKAGKPISHTAFERHSEYLLRRVNQTSTRESGEDTAEDVYGTAA